MAFNKARLCGPGLTTNSLYNQVGFSPTGTPIENFVFCTPISAAGLQLSVMGINILPRVTSLGTIAKNAVGRDIYDIWDIVGQSFYPEAVDFYEEVKQDGFSRKIPKTAPIQFLSKESRHYLLHEKALVSLTGDKKDTAKWQLQASLRMQVECLRHRQNHFDNSADEWCSRMWWFSLDEKTCSQDNRGIWYRTGVNHAYRVYPLGNDLNFQLARFMWMPLGNLVVTKTDDGDLSEENEEVIEKLEKAGLGRKTEVVDINDVVDKED